MVARRQYTVGYRDPKSGGQEDSILWSTEILGGDGGNIEGEGRRGNDEGMEGGVRLPTGLQTR